MEYIDLFKYEEALKKNRFKRMMKKRDPLLSVLLSAVQIPAIIFSDFPIVKCTSGAIIGLELATLRRYWKIEDLLEQTQTINMLRTTTVYYELLNEYQNFILDVASLVKNTDLSTPKEIVLYLYNLIECGFLSQNNNHQYKKFSYEREKLLELCGARVATGTSVCRHSSTFIVDVMNQLGYTAANVSCRAVDDSLIDKRKIIFNHCVLAVSENNSKFLFDTTSGDFIAKPRNLDLKDLESFEVMEYVLPILKQYLIINPNMASINFGRKEQCQKIMDSSLCSMSPQEVFELIIKVDELCERQNGNHKLFYQEHKRQLDNISNLYQELQPYSDEKILKHVIRK